MEKQLPKNWVESKLGNLVVIERGGSPRPIENYLTDSEDGINWIKISDATASDKYIYKTKQKIKPEGLYKTRYVKEGDFLLSNSMSFGRPYIMKTDGCIHDGWLALKEGKIKIFNTEFLYYLLSSSFVFNQFDSLASGSTVRNLNKELVSSVIVKIPPLAEQNRIVAKLDTLFARLETIKTSMANIPLLLKDFRQQVLTQAVTGKLTEEWRKGKELDKLTLIELSHFCKDSFYGPRFSKDDYTDEGFPTVRTTDMSDDGKIILSDNIPRIKIDDPKKIELYKVKKGDLLITRTGSIGKMARYFEEEIVIPSAYLIRFRFNELAITDYIYYCLISPYGQNQMGLNSVAVTQPNLNAQKIKTIKIPKIKIEEQQEIVSRVESLFAKADTIEEQYKSLKVKIDTLPQALLHKAFKGELTEQLGSDGDARELLKQIQELKEQTSQVVKKKSKKNNEVQGILG